MDIDENEVPEIMTDGMDERSIYVGNVDYSVTPDALKEHFKDCGEVVRVTIPHDSFKCPKGFGYLQFASEEGMKNALTLDNTMLAGRHIKVRTKRVNQPGMGSITNRGGGGWSYDGRGKGGWGAGRRGGMRVRTVVRYVYITGRGNRRSSNPPFRRHW